MGITLLNAPPRGRTYPNMNVMMGIRLFHRVGNVGGAKPLPFGNPGKAIPIGTIPANSFLHSAIAYVSTAYDGTTPTLDIGGATYGTPPTTAAFTFPISTGVALGAIAKLPQTLTFGYIADEMEIYARLRGTTAPTVGAVDYVLQFYTNQN